MQGRPLNNTKAMTRCLIGGVQRETHTWSAELEISAAIMKIFDAPEAGEKYVLLKCHEKRGLFLYNP